MRRNSDNECCKYYHFEIEQYLVGEMDDGEVADLHRHMDSCDSCSRRLEAARAAGEHFRSTYLPELLKEPVVVETTRLKSPLIHWRWGLAGGLATAAVILAAVVAIPEPAREPELPWVEPGQIDEEQAKGGGVMEMLLVQEDGGRKRVTEGMVLRPGDRVRFRPITGEYPYLVVFSVEERTGRVSVHYPSRGDASMRLTGPPGVLLPDALTLDDYVGAEVFGALFSTAPVSVAAAPTLLAQAHKWALAYEAIGIEVFRRRIVKAAE